MPRTLKVNVARMVADARARIEEIEASDAISLMGDPQVVIVDIRDVRERQRGGYIPGSFHCPRGMVEFWVDPAKPLLQGYLRQGCEIYISLRLGLALGDNSRHTCSAWASTISPTSNDGFTSWQEAGGPVERADPDRTSPASLTGVSVPPWRSVPTPRWTRCRAPGR